MFSQKTFYDRLMEFIKDKGMSQGKFAEKLGINSQNISAYRPDAKKPSLPKADFIASLIEAFPDIDIKYILGSAENHSKVFYRDTIDVAERHHRNTVEEDPGEPMGYDTDEVSKLKKEIDILKMKNQHTEELLLKLYERSLPVQKDKYKQREDFLE